MLNTLGESGNIIRINRWEHANSKLVLSEFAIRLSVNDAI
jgi:hypothetical protein